MHVTLPRTATFEAWRDAARRLHAASVPPEAVTWSRGAPAGDLFSQAEPLPEPAPEAPAPNVPKTFLATARLAAWHRDPERFARLYALLHAVARDPHLMADRGDPRVARLEKMAKEVARDKHKMTAFVRFREIGDPAAPRRRFAAWFEPSHFIAEPAAPFFAKRFGDMDWTIFTPDLTAHFENGETTFAPGEAKPPLPEDAAEDLWRTYFRNIFNPARLMVKAMQSEMPKKYWKNLPEADLIPELVASAHARARRMAETAPTLPPLRAERIATRLAAEAPPPPETYEAALQACRRCPLWQNATQAVPGEGPEDAALMIVGEQPGDREDLTGRPFVGPAGQLFDRLAREAGIDRAAAFVTNAVKHFKHRPRGKRRLHQNPDAHEIRHCKWWLDIERARVKPRLILALGGTALESLTGSRKDLLKRRGTLEQAEDGTPILVTVHPSYLLRIPDHLRAAETVRFRDDLALAARHLARLAA